MSNHVETGIGRLYKYSTERIRSFSKEILKDSVESGSTIISSNKSGFDYVFAGRNHVEPETAVFWKNRPDNFLANPSNPRRSASNPDSAELAKETAGAEYGVEECLGIRSARRSFAWLAF